MILLDTSIIIDHLRQKGKETFLLKLVRTHDSESLSLSILSIQELYEGKNTSIPEKETALLATIGPLTILPYPYEVAKHAGEIAREISSGITFADAAIAATAIEHGAHLFTLNRKHFEKIPSLSLFSL